MTSKHWALVGGAVACLKPIAIFSTLGLFAAQAHAWQNQKDLAYPGYSGFLNVPSATVLNHGQASVQWSDQAYLSGREGFGGGRYGYLNNMAATFGVFPNIEVGGRMVWDKTQTNCYREGCTIRDLSANVKIQAPLIPEKWFSLAAGAQDLGGQTDDFTATYLVAGKHVGPVEVAVGYGKTDISSRYLDGAFGAISYRPLPWLNIIAEHDSQNVRIGVGASTQKDWLPLGLQIKGKVLAWDNSDADDTRNFVSIGLSLPFGNADSKPIHRKEITRLTSKQLPKKVATQKNNYHPEPVTAGPGPISATENISNREDNTAVALGQRLVSAGYENVRTAGNGDTLYIWWENNLYNRDERTSVIEVASMVRRIKSRYQRAELTLLNQGLPVLTQALALSEQAVPTATRLSNTSLFNPDQPDWDFKGSYGPTWKPRLTLSPAISSGVATEYGVWDASVALKSELAFHLWPGALAAARYDVEIYQTEDFEKGGVFYNNRQQTALVEAEVQQTFKLHPQIYTSFHAGRYDIDYNGALNETVLLSSGGRHAVGFLGGSFRHKDNRNVTRTQALASYRYYNAGLDTELEVHAGEFFEDDSGVRIDTRFWFGDYAITLGYKNTDASFVSLGWVIPLTPVKDEQWRYLQIKGDANWNYNIQTRVNEDSNDVSFGGARIIDSANPISEVYLNRGRIGH